MTLPQTKAARAAHETLARVLERRGLHAVNELVRPGYRTIRVGGTVVCSGTLAGRYRAVVKRLLADEREEVVEVELFGGKPGREMTRTVRPDAVRWAKPRDGATNTKATKETKGAAAS